MPDNSHSTPCSLLGLTVYDSITRIKGVVTAEIFYLYGCQQVQVSPAPKDSTEGKLPDAIWLDRTRVEVDFTTPRKEPLQQQATGFTTPPPSRDPKGL